MAFFDENIECSDKVKKRVRVPGQQGQSDRNIYVNGKNSGYYLGSGNDKIYRSGSEVSSSSIRNFAKQSLKWFIWRIFKTAICSFFVCIENWKSKIYPYTKFLKYLQNINENISIEPKHKKEAK